MAFDASTDARRSVVREALESVVLMLAPVVPHVCHTLWFSLGHREPIIDAAWPVADAAAMSRDVIELVVQVNGKLRGHVSVGADADREAVEREAQRNDNVARFIGEKPIRRSLWFPDGSSTSSYDALMPMTDARSMFPGRLEPRRSSRLRPSFRKWFPA